MAMRCRTDINPWVTCPRWNLDRAGNMIQVPAPGEPPKKEKWKLCRSIDDAMWTGEAKMESAKE